jgi:ribonuclease R
MPRKTPPKFKSGQRKDAALLQQRPPKRDGDPRLSKPTDEVLSKPRRASAVSRADFTDPFREREAQKYEQPIPSREAILAFLVASPQLLTIEALAAGLKLNLLQQRDALDKRIQAMLRDGQLLLNRRGGLAVAEKADLIPGTILANADGFGFLRRDADAAPGDDIFLPPLQMKKVLHGDRALVSITGSDARGRSEGLIVEVLERRSPKIVGRYMDEALFGVVVPDDRRVHQDIQIPRGYSMGARPGDVVVAEITEAPNSHRPPIGRVVRIFGQDIGPQHAIDLAIESFDLPHVFPAAVNVQTAVIADSVEDWQRKGRVDLRELKLVTIDGEDARDFDDAVWCEAQASGYRLVVAIADVASYVPMGSALDEEAAKRSTSVYFPARVIPMLPEKLSNGVCSLKPEVDRLCLVCDMQIDASGKTKRSKFYPAVMRSVQRLTYNVVWDALGKRDKAALERVQNVLPELQQLYALYHVLEAARKTRGAIEFEGREVHFGFSPEGNVAMVKPYARNDAHKIIEECMIAANVAAARFLAKEKVPAAFRVHAPPPLSKYEDARNFLSGLGIMLPEHDQLTPALVTETLRKAKKRADFTLIEAVLLRSQSLAVYAAKNEGHFGLALDAYAHFTSPIRRYPDLLVHRAIYHALGADGKNHADYSYSTEKMAELTKTCSGRERRADEASRDVADRLKCAYMEQHIGEDFKALVTGVTSFGAFVELQDNGISGMVHVTQLPNDYYHFDASRHRLWGERTRMGLRLGDIVQVKLLRVDATERKIDFKLLSGLSAVPAKELSATPSAQRTRRR